VPPNLALTYDDGPDPDGTPRLLDVLAQVRATATFFPITSRAAAHPALIERMLAEGHTVGLHCQEHIRHSQLTEAELRGDTQAALTTLCSLHVRPRLWRTPWGDSTASSRRIARETRLRIVGWDHDTHDWRGDSAPDMFARARIHLRPGKVVLAHDGIGPGALRGDIGETIAFTRMVGEHAARQGLALEALR
jgi:peptidoglycan/xylan/chitin deacetylase (PgdA/CDA1 family)